MAEEVVEALRRLGGEARLWELEESLRGMGASELGRALWDLRASRAIEMYDPSRRRSLASYLAGPEGWWFWLYVFGVAMGAAAAFLVPRSPAELEFVRVVMGAPSLFYLPGYGLLRSLYPERRWGSPEEAAMSISLSLAILPLVGLVLVGSPLRMTVASTAASILGLDVVLGLVAAYRRVPHDMPPGGGRRGG